MSQQADPARRWDTAVVVGGSIAGLCAARVLAPRFARVVVLDRDAFPAGAQGRAGVPQGRHVHTLLARGCRELDRFFPGFERLMLERGAQRIDFGTEFACLRQDGWSPRLRGGVPTLFASRGLTESIVRELLAGVADGVEVRQRATAVGLVTSGAPRRVSGVRVAGESGVETIAADLVVDASGRSSKAPEWLREIGVAPPAETVVDSNAGYGTRWYQAPAAARWPREWWWKAIWIDIDLERPEGSFAGVLFPVEDGQWIVTLAGVAGHHPPSDEAGFVRALAALRSPILAQATALATPASKVHAYRAMANRHRHFERWDERLGGFLAVGDASCTFNPVYGQGMTTAALAASVLEQRLARDDVRHPEFPRRFFRAQASLLRDAWALATGADFRLPSTLGRRPVGFALSTRYMDALFRAANRDLAVRTRLSEVINMLRPPAALFAPGVVARVAIDGLRHGLAAPPRPAETPPLPPLTAIDEAA